MDSRTGPWWRLVFGLLKRLPQGMLSRMAGRLADLPIPRFARGVMIGGFARAVGIDRGEAEAPPIEYPSIGAYFVRRLRAGARVWPDDPDLPASPVDGIVGALGELDAGRLIQAKGLDYSAGDLLGDTGDGALFEGGRFLTIYLSPRHYHRIHTPVAGRIVLARSIPGALLPVNPPAVRGIPELFPRNERLVVHLERGSAGNSNGSADAGRRIVLVAVGALNVGRISAAFDAGWVTNRPRRERPGPELRRYDIEVGVGSELAAFHLGSTVVLLFAPSASSFHPDIRPGAGIRLGAPLFE